ncbi:hypothetical protein GCM10011364_05650 [Mangrovimonas yunxiaonensis]|nr:hypothetical protein GCM10011364_05650 [Mangrovimonas yunxiaonensis]
MVSTFSKGVDKTSEEPPQLDNIDAATAENNTGFNNLILKIYVS